MAWAGDIQRLSLFVLDIGIEKYYVNINDLTTKKFTASAQ